MRHLLRLAGLGLMAGVLTLLTSGCGFAFSPEELYSLPALPAEYTELNNCINQIIEGGAEYAAPVSGTNIQPVQMRDLDGDGQQEAVAFFRNSADEKPLKICIFTAVGDTYEQTAVIEGSGTSIYSIEYNDLDNDGRQELIVGWRVSTDAQALTVYSLRGGQPEELMRTNYVKYAVTDLDQDELLEMVVLRSDEEGNGLADYYRWQDDVLSLQSYARISSTMAELSGQQGRVQKGALADLTPALFITGVEDASWSVTDILTLREGELYNLLLSDVTGVSEEIVSYYGLYPTDINSDGVMELPQPLAVSAQGLKGIAMFWVQGLLGFYGGLLLYGGATLLAEWKQIDAPAKRKVAFWLVFPLFMCTYIPISLQALFCRVEWKPIQHHSAAALGGRRKMPVAVSGRIQESKR